MPRSQHYKCLCILVFTCFPKTAWESRVIANVCRLWPLLSGNAMLCDWDRAVCESGTYWGKKHFNYFEAVEWAKLKFPVLNMGAVSNHCSEFGSLMTSACCHLLPRGLHDTMYSISLAFLLLPECRLPKFFAGLTTDLSNCLFPF